MLEAVNAERIRFFVSEQNYDNPIRHITKVRVQKNVTPNGSKSKQTGFYVEWPTSMHACTAKPCRFVKAVNQHDGET